MLCLSFYEWRCIYSGEQMILATFLEKNSLDRAPRRFADYLFVPKHQKADVLLTTVLGPLRRATHSHWEWKVVNHVSLPRKRSPLQSFSQKSRTPTVAKEFQIGLYDPAEADLELFCNSWSAGFFGERL